MGDQDHRLAIDRQGGEKCAQGVERSFPIVRPSKKGVQRRQGLYRPKLQQAGRFECAAPLAGKDSRIVQAERTQTGAQLACLSPAAGIEIALRGAIADDKIRRVAEPRRMGMSQHQHTARLGKFAKRQDRVIGPRRKGP